MSSFYPSLSPRFNPLLGGFLCVFSLLACSEPEGFVEDAMLFDVSDGFAVEDVDGELDVQVLNDAGFDAVQDAVPDAEPEEVWPSGPPLVLFTINEIPAFMNGSTPYTRADFPDEEFDFLLRVNRHDFTLDMILEPGSGRVSWEELEVSCSEPILGGGGEVLYGEETILPTELFAVHSSRGRRIHFGEGLFFEESDEVRCAAKVVGPDGEVSVEMAFSAADLPDHLDPFVEPDVWLVVLSRDLFETELVVDESGTRLLAHYLAGGSGRADFEDVFYTLGLFTDEAPETRDHLRAWFLDTI
ncbi:MAG: hypothetical protein ACNA8W_15740, partial [Bradymonadaceae bacterium]